jgi:hypothetical protein
MRAVQLLVVCALVLCASQESFAAGRFRRAQQQNGYKRPTPTPNPYARELYPKYEGGFHARQLQNIGIPTGDVGIRGNGIYMNPW